MVNRLVSVSIDTKASDLVFIILKIVQVRQLKLLKRVRGKALFVVIAKLDELNLIYKLLVFDIGFHPIRLTFVNVLIPDLRFLHNRLVLSKILARKPPVIVKDHKLWMLKISLKLFESLVLTNFFSRIYAWHIVDI